MAAYSNKAAKIWFWISYCCFVQITKYKENANNKVKINSIEPGRDWCIFPDTIEDIDEDEEECDKHGHPEV